MLYCCGSDVEWSFVVSLWLGRGVELCCIVVARVELCCIVVARTWSGVVLYRCDSDVELCCIVVARTFGGVVLYCCGSDVEWSFVV